MIVYDITNGTAGITELYSTKRDINSSEFYELLPVGCAYDKITLDIPQFVNPDNSDSRENDKYNFTFNVDEGYSVNAFLVKGEDEFEITDQTYGDYDDLGTIANSPNTWGFILLWKNVQAVQGYGNYTFRIEIVNTATTEVAQNIYAPCFRLMKYDCETANKTVKLFVSQKGYLKSGMDWRNLQGTGYENYEVRLYGRLTRTGYESVTENITDTEDRSRQVSTGIFEKYTLSLNWIGSFISDAVMQNFMLGSPVKISDYNLGNIKTYNEIELNYLDADDPTQFVNLNQEFFKINLEDYQKQNIKQH